MGFIAPILSVAGTAIQVYSKYQAASYEADMQKYNAQVAETQAQQKRMETRESIRRQRSEADRFKDTQRAAFAKAGITGTGTPLAVMSQTAADLELAALDTAYSGESQAQSLMQRAAVNRSNAKMTKFGRNVVLATDGITIGKNLLTKGKIGL